MKGRALLVFHEGRRQEPYRDSEGYWSIGIGRCIDRRAGCSIPPGLRIPMTTAEVDELFEQDLHEHIADLHRIVPWVRQLDEVRYHVIAEMFFNLGPEPFDGDGHKDWPIFIRQVRSGEYIKAAANMRQTLWARQIGKRAQRLADMMESGQWPREPGVPVIS